MRVTMADIKPSLANALTFFLMWLVVVSLAKFLLLYQFHIPGLSDLVRFAGGN